MADLEALKSKYASVLKAGEQVGLRLENLHIQDEKLFIRGGVPSEFAKNQIWDEIKRRVGRAAELMQIVQKLYLIAPTHGELDTPLGRRVQTAVHVELLENWEPTCVEGDTYARRLAIRSPPNLGVSASRGDSACTQTRSVCTSLVGDTR